VAFGKTTAQEKTQISVSALGSNPTFLPEEEQTGRHLDLKPVRALSERERNALQALTAAVYPPEVLATSPGRLLQWAPAQWSVLASTGEGQRIAHVGIVTRAGTLDGVPVHIGGIGSRKTHPQAQGQGDASAALRRAAMALHDDYHVAFSLLVCQAERGTAQD
jgi:hypothetical protein